MITWNRVSIKGVGSSIRTCMKPVVMRKDKTTAPYSLLVAENQIKSNQHENALLIAFSFWVYSCWLP